MRAEIFLSHRYIKAHKKQALGVVLVTALFIAAFITAMIYKDSYQATIAADLKKVYGAYSGIIYDADSEKINLNAEKIKNSNSGIVYGANKVISENDKDIYIGYIDSNAMELCSISLKEGRLPESDNEIAIENNTYERLFLTAQVGEKVIISVNENGNAIEKEYTLVGILNDYVSNWQRYDSSKKSELFPPPSLLSTKNEDSIKYANVICADSSIKNEFGGTYYSNYFAPNSPETLQRQSLVDKIVFPILCFFVVVMVFGISSILIFTLKERRKYLGLLRCIGLKKRKGVGMFLIQGAELFLASAIVGGMLGIALSYIFVLLSGLFGHKVIFTLSFASFLWAWIIAGITIIVTFTISSAVFFRKAPLNTADDKHKRSKAGKSKECTLVKVWSKSLKKEYRLQNFFSVLLSAACIFVAMFGFFFATYLPRVDYYGVDKIAHDYRIYIPSGSSSYDNFNLTLPRNSGVTQQNLNKIYATEDLSVLSAYMTYTSSHFFLLKSDDTNQYLSYLADVEKRVLTNRNNHHLSEALSAVGGKDTDRLVEPYINGMDYQTALKEVSLTAGSIDKEGFVSGKQIIAPDIFNIGDTFVMLTPIIKNSDATEIRFEFAVSEVTVGATYPGNYNSNIILSAEYITETDPSARYDMIVIKNNKSSDAARTAEIDKMLNNIVSESSHVQIDNTAELKQVYRQTLVNGQIQVVFSVFIFVLVIIVTIALSTYVKIRTNMHSYILMRAIGANKKTIIQLIKEDVSSLLLKGCIIGMVPSFVLAVILHLEYTYVTAIDVFAIMALIAVVVFALLYSLTMLCIKKPIQHILDVNIVSSINSVEL